MPRKILKSIHYVPPSLPQVKRANPEKNCFLEYDRLYIDHKIYVYNDVMGQESVLRH